MEKQSPAKGLSSPLWIPLSRSMALLLTRLRLFGWALFLVALTFILTWFGYRLCVDFFVDLSRPLFGTVSDPDSLFGWIKYSAWLAAHWTFTVFLKVLAFYLAFIAAYTLATPGYALLSAAAERLHQGPPADPEPARGLMSLFYDIAEGAKIGLLGVVVTVIAFAANFVPVIGQIIVLLLYTGYSTLMFIDFPASRRNWNLTEKLRWLGRHPYPTLRLGLLPALVSMVPLLNIFVLALLFPLLTIHATVNFNAIQRGASPLAPSPRECHAR
ncbi:MAG TPA: EI24 domain-containing protein [Desulforhopalus sp.]|nr:EI24 domain-containing protein [Desulforhopalus sp.]